MGEERSEPEGEKQPSHDPRDELWDASFETYYDAFYEELLCDRLISRWQYADEVTKVLVALTASGSAIAGWALWTQPEWKVVWTAAAGIAAVLSIVHTALGVAGRIKDHGEVRRQFAGVRTDLETFRYLMRIDPKFAVDSFTKDFVGYRKRIADGVQQIKDDILKTDRLRNRVQIQLNVSLGEEIVS